MVELEQKKKAVVRFEIKNEVIPNILYVDMICIKNKNKATHSHIDTCLEHRSQS